MAEGKATARARVSFDLHFTQPWGDDCTVAQIRKQAQDGAHSAVSRIIEAVRGKDLGATLERATIYPDIELVLKDPK